MQSRRFIGYSVVLILGFWSAIFSNAQTLDGPVAVAVNIKAYDLQWGYSGDGYLDLDINDVNGYSGDSAIDSDQETPQFTAWLEPGKTYFLNISSYDLGDLTIQSLPPPGYLMELERLPTERVTVGYPLGSIRVRVLAPYQEYNGRGGTATAATSGRVFWQMALGDLANGSSAGALSIIDTGTGSSSLSSLFGPSGLLYEQTSSEVEVIYNPLNVPSPYVAGTIRQIIAPQVCADVVITGNSQAEIKVYHRKQLVPGSSSSGTDPYSFTGDPFAWYLINPGTNPPANQVTIQCDLRNLPNTTSTGNTVVSTKYTVLTRSGTSPNYTWTANNWYDDGSSSISQDVRVRSGTNETITLKVPEGDIALAGSRTYASKAWGEEIVAETSGTDSGTKVTSSTEFYENDNQAGGYARMKSRTTTGGRWEAYEYYDESNSSAEVAGAIHKKHSPLLDSDTSVPSDLSDHAGLVTTYTYSLDPFGRKSRPATISTTTLFDDPATEPVEKTVTEISRTEYTYTSNASGFTGHGSLNVVTAVRKEFSNSSSSLTTTIKYFSEDAGKSSASATDDFFRRQTHSISYPDGRKVSFAYQRGSWDEENDSFSASDHNGTDYGPAGRIAIVTGTTQNVGTPCTTLNGYNIDDLNVVDGQSTQVVTVRDNWNRIIRTETHIWSGSQWHPLASSVYNYNLANELTSVDHSDGSSTTINWDGERITSTVDSNGMRTDYDQYDAMGRLTKTTQVGIGSIDSLITRYVYDAASHLLEKRVGAESAENLVSSWAYDDAGRITAASAPGVSATLVAYDPTNRKRTTTLPSTDQIIEKRNPDGSLFSLTESGTVERFYTYSLDGSQWKQKVALGQSGSNRVSYTWTDWLGRTTKTERPGFLPTAKAAFEENYIYHGSTGLLTQITRSAGLKPMSFTYDALGNPESQGIDLDGNGLSASGSDRFTTVTNKIVNNKPGSSDWWLHGRSYTYATNNGSPSDLSESYERLTGLTATLRAETYSIDASDRASVQTVELNSSTHAVTVKSSSDGLNEAETTFIHGLLVSEKGADALNVSYTYDELHRAKTVTDPRSNITTTSYVSGTAFPYQLKETSNNNQTIATYGYDSSGRQNYIQDALGHTNRYAYNGRGQVTLQWGTATTPASYIYNDWGQLQSLSTYRNAPANDSTVWPAAGSPDTTSWTYDQPSGLLWYKTMADTNSVVFDYDDAGRTAMREWVRRKPGDNTQGVKSFYDYDDDTGELTEVSYNDGTPTVTYTYDRLGRIETVDDATGQRTFGYASSDPYRLQTETFDTDSTPADFYNSKVITRLYETTGAKGRYRGFQLGNGADPDAYLQQTVNIAANARITGYTSTGIENNTAVTRNYNYGYTNASNADTRLVHSLSVAEVSQFSVARTYEPNRNLLLSIDSKWSGSSRTRFDYTYNEGYQRATTLQSGSHFTDTGDYGNSTYQRFTYDSRGQLIAAPHYLGTNVSSQSSPLPGREFAYDYDSAGNRKWSGNTGDTNERNDYTVNHLNQVTQRENNTLTVSGTAATGANILVTDSATLAERQGRYWNDQITPNNLSGPARPTLTVHAASPAAGSGGADLLKTETRAALVAQRAQSYTYDFDGNLTGDGLFTYQWDAENRLTQAQTTAAAAAVGAPNQTITFKYDYMSRRVEKSVSVNGGTATVTRFAYDGWNLIAELDSAGNTVNRSYAWGLDLAGSPNSSGGIGALLQIRDNIVNKTLLPTYDGNGNLVSLVNAVGGTVEAVYEYSPFGELLRSEGAYAQKNPFRFSTKYQDQETGLIYYGYRYYDPHNGRFINRDPSEESGGLNLYGFAANDPVNGGDYLGLSLWDWLKGIFTGGGGGNDSPFDDGGWDDPWGYDPWGYDPWGEDLWDDGATYGDREYGKALPDFGGHRSSRNRIVAERQSPYDAIAVLHNSSAPVNADYWPSSDELYIDLMSGVMVAQNSRSPRAPGSPGMTDTGLTLAEAELIFMREIARHGRGGTNDTRARERAMERLAEFRRANGIGRPRMPADAEFRAPGGPLNVRSIGRFEPWETSYGRRVWRRNDIDWSVRRPDGLTNLEAARQGLSPMRQVDGRWERLNLHHLNQDPLGSLVEVWGSVHSRIPHNVPPPSWRIINPEAAESFRREVPAYWRWRVGTPTPEE